MPWMSSDVNSRPRMAVNTTGSILSHHSRSRRSSCVVINKIAHPSVSASAQTSIFQLQNGICLQFLLVAHFRNDHEGFICWQSPQPLILAPVDALTDFLPVKLIDGHSVIKSPQPRTFRRQRHDLFERDVVVDPLAVAGAGRKVGRGRLRLSRHRTGSCIARLQAVVALGLPRRLELSLHLSPIG